MSTKRYVREMKAGEIFGSAFELYRQHLGKLALASVPVVLLSIAYVLYTAALSAADTGAMCASLLFLFLVQNVITYIVSAAILVLTSDSILGRPVSVLGSYRRVFSAVLWGRMMLFGLMAGIVVAVGMLLLIIPGIIFHIWYLFGPFGVVLEQLKARPAMRRSRDLVRDHVGRAFLIYYLPWLLYLVLVNLLGTLVTSVLGIPRYDLVPYQMVAQGIALLGGLVVGPYYSLLSTLLYYDLRARKENYNEDVLAEELGYEPLGEMMEI